MVVLICFMRIPVYAQHPPTSLFVGVNSVDVKAFPEVTLAISVRDANGVPVPNLDASAFEVIEDRAPVPRPIRSVMSATNANFALSLVVVVDVSGSMEGQPLEAAQTAARALIEQLSARDKVALISFADAINFDVLNEAREHPFTADHEAVIALIDGLEAKGSTPLYDALYKAVLWAQESPPGNRAVILLTDGIDEGPGSLVASAETPIQEAARAGVPIFTIALGDEIDRGYLERVARMTGGNYQETPDSTQLTERFLTVLDQLKQQYVLIYESGLSAADADHRVQVNVEIEGRQAGDEAIFKLQALSKPTAQPTFTPAPTETPTPTPLLLTSTPTPVPLGIVVATTARSLWAGLGTALRSVWTWLSGVLWWVVGFVLIVLFLILLISLVRNATRARQVRQMAEQEYCASCGRPLGPDEICLECGVNAGRMRAMDLSSTEGMVS